MSPRAGYAIARGLYSRVFAIAYFSDLPGCLLIEFFCEGINHPPMSQLITSQLIFLSPVTSQLIVMSQVKSCYVLSVAPRSSRSVLRYPRLASSLRDTPLVSERTAVIPKATYFNPPVPELIPLSEALPMMMVGCVHHHRTAKGDGIFCRFSRGGSTCCRNSRSSLQLLVWWLRPAIYSQLVMSWSKRLLLL